MMNDVKKMMVLSARVGAGHIRAADAIVEAFAEKYPGVEVRHLECFKYTNTFFRQSFIFLYGLMAYRIPSFWRLLYEHTERQIPGSRISRFSAWTDGLNSRRLIREVNAFDPDVVLCTHYLPGEIMASLRRRGKLRANVCVQLTDYDIHTMWIQDGVDQYFVATPEMAYALTAKGIGNATASVTGIPLMSCFTSYYPDTFTMRRRLGLRTERPAVLVACGGLGWGDLDKTVTLLADHFPQAQFIAIAGHNEALLERLKLAAKNSQGCIQPFGYVTNMHELMAASNIAVTKCGGLTSSECLAMGLPMIIVHPIPGQEERNSDVLLACGVAVRAHSTASLIYKLKEMLENESLLKRMSHAAREMAKPDAARRVADAVMSRASAVNAGSLSVRVPTKTLPEAQPAPSIHAT